MVRAERMRLSPRIGCSRALSRPWSASIALFACRSVTCRAAGAASSTHARVSRRPIGYDLDRRQPLLQRTSEEASRGGGITPPGDQHVDHLPVLIDRAIQAAPAAGDLDIRFVGTVAWERSMRRRDTDAVITSRSVSSAPAGYWFPREVIAVAVRWYLRYGLSYRDVEELLAERGVEVDHVTIYRWV